MLPQAVVQVQADLYTRIFIAILGAPAQIYVEWATPSTERLYCANTDCANFIPISARLSLSSKGDR